MRYVIIGAGPAGVVAAETLRKQDPKGEVILIGDEPEPAYSRMAIPYLLAEHIDERGTYLRHATDHFENLGIRQIHEKVTAVDGTGHTLTLQSGESINFDRLLIASGSRPVAPPIPGLDQPGVHHCWTLADARYIADYAKAGSKVVLMGAGFIGSIIMEALVERHVELTVLEMGDRMVPRMMDQTAGNLIKHWCIDHGVNVRTSTRVMEVKPDDTGIARLTLECEAAKPIQADLVVVATGVRPETRYLENSGVQIRQGVVVNDYLQTTLPDIYAAGDVCEALEWGTGNHAVHAIQPVAAETGRVAAMNMTGSNTLYAGSLQMNILDSIGLISTSYGQWQGVENGESSELLDEARFRYIKLQFEADRLVGAITLGMTEHVGVLRGLIQSRTRLGRWKEHLMKDPSRIMEAYLGATHSA
ncbi:MAG: NAD(P)/FAD-dependent oxidoreductase [Gammaproteobacteria bacterium]|nr:NAD(P)/FAD-dependent oxidoreductase [Gammaproteobacteria bacterium]